MNRVVVVAPRDKHPKLALAVIIAGFIIFAGFAFLAASIFSGLIKVEDNWTTIIILSVLSILICCFSLPITIFNLVNYIFNKKMKDKPCLEYDAENDKFIIHSVWGKDFSIDNGKIEDVNTASWLYSHEVKILVRNDDKSLLRINMGFSTYSMKGKLRKEINNYQKNAI